MLTNNQRLPVGEIFNSFLYGARMDASLAAYFTAPVILILALTNFFKNFHPGRFIQAYSFVLIVFTVLAMVVDIFVYRSWGTRIEASVLRYLKHPNEVWASINNLLVFLIVSGTIFVLIALNGILKKMMQYHFNSLAKRTPLLFTTCLLFVLAGLLIIPMRGGLQLAPLNQSSVYFSSNHFANLSALNAPWNFVFSTLKYYDTPDEHTYKFLDESIAEKVADSLLHKTHNKIPILKNNVSNPNIILIVWESFTQKAVDYSQDGVAVLPGFNRLIPQGIYFDSVYAAGDRTDKGIVAILSGYPPQPTLSIIKDPAKSSGLAQLGNELKENGYHNFFFYGGELEFANLKSFLLNGSFDRMVSVKDFEKKDLNSKWGAHDCVVADRLKKELLTFRQPFFVSWLTLSSHEPFETPVPVAISGDDDQSLFLNSLHYTDSVVTEFIDFCSRQTWWDNTLVVITADHGHPLPATNKKIDNNGCGFINKSGYSIIDNVSKKTIETGGNCLSCDSSATSLERRFFRDFIAR